MQPLSEMHVPTGAPPTDVVGSSRAVRQLFARLTEEDVPDDLDHVQQGRGLGACLRESRRRSPVGPGLEVVVNELLFLSESTAVVRFTFVTATGRYGPMEGRALRDGDAWVIERATFCSLVGRVGVRCPPPR